MTGEDWTGGRWRAEVTWSVVPMTSVTASCGAGAIPELGFREFKRKFRDLPYLGIYLQNLGLAEYSALKAEDGKGQD